MSIKIDELVAKHILPLNETASIGFPSQVWHNIYAQYLQGLLKPIPLGGNFTDLNTLITTELGLYVSPRTIPLRFPIANVPTEEKGKAFSVITLPTIDVSSTGFSSPAQLYIGYDNETLYYRQGRVQQGNASGTTIQWSDWQQIITTTNYDAWIPKMDGSNIPLNEENKPQYDWPINITGGIHINSINDKVYLVGVPSGSTDLVQPLVRASGSGDDIYLSGSSLYFKTGDNITISGISLSRYEINLAGKSIPVLNGFINASDLRTNLGLSSALRYVGEATVRIADGGVIDPKIDGYDFANAKQAGDVILYNGNEYIWSTGGAWEILGSAPSFKLRHENILNPSVAIEKDDNGSPIVDEDGKTIPLYTNSVISDISQDGISGIINPIRKLIEPAKINFSKADLILENSLPIENGGTDATDVLTARRNLQVSSLAARIALPADGNADLNNYTTPGSYARTYNKTNSNNYDVAHLPVESNSAFILDVDSATGVDYQEANTYKYYCQTLRFLNNTTIYRRYYSLENGTARWGEWSATLNTANIKSLIIKDCNGSEQQYNGLEDITLQNKRCTVGYAFNNQANYRFEGEDPEDARALPTGAWFKVATISFPWNWNEGEIAFKVSTGFYGSHSIAQSGILRVHAKRQNAAHDTPASRQRISVFWEYLNNTPASPLNLDDCRAYYKYTYKADGTTIDALVCDLWLKVRQNQTCYHFDRLTEHSKWNEKINWELFNSQYQVNGDIIITTDSAENIVATGFEPTGYIAYVASSVLPIQNSLLIYDDMYPQISAKRLADGTQQGFSLGRATNLWKALYSDGGVFLRDGNASSTANTVGYFKYIPSYSFDKDGNPVTATNGTTTLGTTTLRIGSANPANTIGSSEGILEIYNNKAVSTIIQPSSSQSENQTLILPNNGDQTLIGSAGNTSNAPITGDLYLNKNNGNISSIIVTDLSKTLSLRANTITFMAQSTIVTSMLSLKYDESNKQAIATIGGHTSLQGLLQTQKIIACDDKEIQYANMKVSRIGTAPTDTNGGVVGIGQLVAGNHLSSGEDGNAKGEIGLYGENQYFTLIVPATLTDAEVDKPNNSDSKNYIQLTLPSNGSQTLIGTAGNTNLAGNLIPAQGQLIDLGSSAQPWTNIHATTIYGALNGSIKITPTNPTSQTTYYPIWTAGTSNNQSLLSNNGFRYMTSEGVVGSSGVSVLSLGNSIDSTTAAQGKYGRIRLYGTNAYYTAISPRLSATYNQSIFYLPEGGRNSDSCYAVWSPNPATAVGSLNQPVYIATNGKAVVCNTYAGGTKVTLNETSKAATTANFYAPTDAGTAGQYLKSNGSGAPTWTDTTVSNTWTAGKAAGPKLTITVNGVTSLQAAIPSASDTASGIVTTGKQTFAGVKTFAANHLDIAGDSTKPLELWSFKDDDTNDDLHGFCIASNWFMYYNSTQDYLKITRKIVLNAQNYGASLPATGTTGQIFFKLI